MSSTMTETFNLPSTGRRGVKAKRKLLVTRRRPENYHYMACDGNWTVEGGRSVGWERYCVCAVCTLQLIKIVGTMFALPPLNRK